MDEIRELIKSCKFPLGDDYAQENGINFVELDIKELIKKLTDTYFLLPKDKTRELKLDSTLFTCEQCRVFHNNKCNQNLETDKCPSGKVYFQEDEK